MTSCYLWSESGKLGSSVGRPLGRTMAENAANTVNQLEPAVTPGRRA